MMSMKANLSIARTIVGVLLCVVSMNAQAVWVRLMAIGPGRAELLINNSRTAVMRPGETTPEGVRLKSLTANDAVVEANGQNYRLILGGRIEPMVVLAPDRLGHYASEIVVNGRTVRALIDTGASGISFNRSEAERLGIQYQSGRQVSMSTANGTANAYVVTLDSVQMGPILLKDVEAVVSVSTNSPEVSLVGMTFLRRLEMETAGGQLRLKQTR